VLTAETLREARWFGGKGRAIADTRAVDCAPLVEGASLQLLEVTYSSGAPETYILVDKLHEPTIGRAILELFRGASIPTEQGGRLEFRPTHVLDSVSASEVEPVRPMQGEQSNTSIRFGNALILKLFRRLQFGPNPDVEIGWFLTENTPFRGTPPVAGSLTYTNPAGAEASLALLQRFERNRGDAWTTTLQRLHPVLAGADAAESLAAVRRLGTTTAELHVALASGQDPDFAPEAISRGDVDTWCVAVQQEVASTVDALAAHGISLDDSLLRERAAGVRTLEGALKTRHHGDYHLGQVLEREDETFVIIDFEGEPSRPLAHRREKRSPLRDVAGMLRSFDYARTAALRSGDASDPARTDRATTWYEAAREAFLDAYLPTARRHAGLIPSHFEPPLSALELEKAAYEVMYELNNRPAWLPIPLAAFSVGS
jgi:maltose alpha-D-glucosyltransferase / alpha-amylase